MQLNDTIKEICLPSEVLSIYPKHREWVDKCISECRTCFLAKKNQMTVGCAIIKVGQKNPNMLKLCFLFVLPDCRSQGYARKIISAVEEYASTIGLRGVYTTINSKANSIERFIYACGYEKIGETKCGDIVFQRIFNN